MKCLVVCLMLFTIVLAQEARYDNYSLHTFVPRTIEQLQKLKELRYSGLPLEFWADPDLLNGHVPIMVPPHKNYEFLDLLPYLQMDHTLKTDNLQRWIDECNPPTTSNPNIFNWERFHNLEVMYNWMEDLALRNYRHVKLITVGRSYEGREIRGIKVSFRKGNKAVFIEGGIHAREWIGPATATYILNQLLTSKNPKVKKIAESFDWYIVPSVNPDGYAYTHNKNRLWRKTRHPYGICTGVDANRNWDFHWNETGTTRPCWENNPGVQPFSEPEAKTLSEYISTIGNDIVVYLAMHSFGQLLLIPYGLGTHCENYDEMLEVGQMMAKSIEQRHGTNFVVGNWGDILYASSGVSVDWVKSTYNVPFIYTVELRDRGNRGFLLPSDQIVGVGEEIMDGLITLINEVKARGY